jgi:4-hydroxy-tetrahydrodipicolinate synthase
MFTGSMVALVTPMADDGSIDLAAFEALIEWHIASGTDALVICGTTGESATLETVEQVALIAAAVRIARGRIPVIAGTGANATAHAVELTRAAHAVGAAAGLSVVPYYNKPTQEGMYRHFRAIAAAAPLPLILYNVPGRTVADLLPETVARLARVPGVVGIKEATGDLARLAAIRALVPADFDLISGDDATAREFILAGGRGVISVTANLAPGAMHEMCAAALRGDAAAAARLDAPLTGLHRDLFAEANPIPAKWALAALGRIPGGLRLPLTPLDPVHHDRVRQALRQAGLEVSA